MANAIYAQSGGVTSVINASASGVISSWREYNKGILYAAENGILGVLNEELIDTSSLSNEEVNKLRQTPGGAFGSCRYKLKGLEHSRREYERIIEVFAAYNIEYFFYNGGNDSADTCLKVSQIANELGYPIKAVHIPKTIDNDLVVTDNCPGFGSVAKYVATSIREAGFDLQSMYPFEEDKFLKKVQSVVDKVGYCVIAASEGICDINGKGLGASSVLDDFGHAQLGGVASILASLIEKKLGLKQHYAIADYLQRSARHLSSRTDVEQAYYVGHAGVQFAVDGQNAVMAYIKRVSDTPYLWEVHHAPLVDIANKEKFMPRDFIDDEGFHVTQKCRDYIEPLILGEDYPQYLNGLPDYLQLEYTKVSKKLNVFKK